MTENTKCFDDEYVASIPDMGLEFLFNSSQILVAVFMTPVDYSGFNPFKGKNPRLVEFKTGNEAMESAKEKSLKAQHIEAKHDDVFGNIPEWVKFNFDSYFVYEFG